MVWYMRMVYVVWYGMVWYGMARIQYGQRSNVAILWNLESCRYLCGKGETSSSTQLFLLKT